MYRHFVACTLAQATGRKETYDERGTPKWSLLSAHAPSGTVYGRSRCRIRDDLHRRWVSPVQYPQFKLYHIHSGHV
ncbi:MAG: hypothetical protein KIG32_07540 [Ruminiclostridium sp.]|nr:hypothetical protein [Ruminiclostridium sp.]